MTEKARLQAQVHGYVQGVYFRASTRDQAAALGLTGWVRNLPSGQDVEIEAEGEREQLEKLIAFLKTGPPGARVEEVSVIRSEYTGLYTHFRIRD
jgi:acylphosphatase